MFLNISKLHSRYSKYVWIICLWLIMCLCLSHVTAACYFGTKVFTGRFGIVTRELRRGTRKPWKEGDQVGKSGGLERLVYDRSGRTSFPECSVRVSGRKRTKRMRRPGTRDRETKLERHRSREHRNAGRIALSPADRRSISYEYRCPWRYTAREPRGVLPKICTGHPHTRIGASPSRTRSPPSSVEMSHQLRRTDRYQWLPWEVTCALRKIIIKAHDTEDLFWWINKIFMIYYIKIIL